jgi:hypothetical protein
VSAPNEHGVYPADEILELPSLRKGWKGGPIAEIRLAHCEDGWRSSTGFGFSGGDYWGSWSPIFGGSTAFQTRQEAIDHAATHLRGKLAGRTGAEASAIFAWLDSLKLAQPDLFGAAA